MKKNFILFRRSECVLKILIIVIILKLFDAKPFFLRIEKNLKFVNLLHNYVQKHPEYSGQKNFTQVTNGAPVAVHPAEENF